MRRHLAHTVFVIAVTVFWLYWQFPAGAVKQFVICRAASLAPQLTFAVERVDFSFPIGVDFKNLAVVHSGVPVLSIARLRLVPTWQSLQPHRAVFDLAADIQGGSASGRIDLDTGAAAGVQTLRLNLDRIQLAGLPFWKRYANRGLTGLCNGRIVWTPGRKGQAMQASFILENGSLEIRLPLLEGQALSFARIESEIEVHDHMVTLRRIVWKGPEIDGEGSGTIHMKTPLDSSPVEIRGKIRPSPAFLAHLRQSIPQPLMPEPGPGGGYAIAVAGTLADPRYRSK